MSLLLKLVLNAFYFVRLEKYRYLWSLFRSFTLFSFSRPPLGLVRCPDPAFGPLFVPHSADLGKTETRTEQKVRFEFRALSHARATNEQQQPFKNKMAFINSKAQVLGRRSLFRDSAYCF